MTAKPKRRMYQRSEVESIATKGERAMEQLGRLAADLHPEHNPMRQLRLFRRYVNDLVDWAVLISEANKRLGQALMMETPNSHLPWGSDEDIFLVDARAAASPIHEIAMELGRTPAACATRLSQLTGIPRPQLIAAYLEGTLNEEPVHGLFQGRMVRDH